MLELLNDVERRTLDAYVALLAEQLGERLLPIRVFGSVARGERWPAGMPIRSDLDVLVLVREPLTEPEEADASPSRQMIDADAVEVWP